MLEQIKTDTLDKMNKAISALKKDLLTLRTGRASASMLDKVYADYYGSETPINQMANISTPDSRTLAITPWDKSLVANIERAILNSDLGLTPNTDSGVIRISIPRLTEERRSELVKMGKRMGEEAKVSIRNIRRDANEAIKKSEKKSEFSEDESRRAQDEIQKITTQRIQEVDKVMADKEKEILEV